MRRIAVAHSNKPILFILYIILIVLLFYRLESVPPVWYDEGWILSVARNWVEYQHYGQLLNGDPIPVTLTNTGKPAIALYMLSFKFLGVGGYQGRLISALLTLINIGLLYHLASKLYNPSIGLASVLICLLVLPSISFNTAINPIIIGRQAMGEMPALFYLLLGCVSFVHSNKNIYIGTLLTVIFWGLAGLTKLQLLPSLIACLSVPIGVMLIQRDWRSLKLYSYILCGLLLFFFFFRGFSPVLDPRINPDSQKQLLSITAFVPIISKMNIDHALSTLLVFSPPAVVGFVYSLIKWFKNKRQRKLSNNELLELSLISLGLSWILWFIFLSVGWTRHLFIPSFIGSIFIATLMQNLGYSLKGKRGINKSINLFNTSRPISQNVTRFLF